MALILRRNCRLVTAGLILLVSGLSGVPLWAADSETSTGLTIDVVKLPTCSCCVTWIKYLEANGFVVHSTEVQDMAPVRQQSGVPEKIAGCHTATIGGYVIDGHVSADEIRRLLAERPPIRGLVVTGMPPGSPGMEAPATGPYDVLALQNDGTTRVYVTHEMVPESSIEVPSPETGVKSDQPSSPAAETDR